MTTNKPGSVNQQPLYGCTSCYEDYSWCASDLRVHDGECWCELCWDEIRWEFPDQPYWNDLEPYTPASQHPDVTQLVEELHQSFPLLDDKGLDEDEHHCEWSIQQERKRLHAILAPYRKGGE